MLLQCIDLLHGRQVRLVFITACLTSIVIVLSSCLSTVPVTGGASNIKRGEFDPYASLGFNLSMYNLWDDLGTGGRNTILFFGPGLRYGIVDAVNADLLVWSSIFEAGASPSLHLQLIDARQRLNLCLRGNVSTGLFDGDNTVEFWGLPELIWGPSKYFFVGIRYEHRLKYRRIERITRRYSKDMVEFEDSTSVTPLLCAFVGMEYGPEFYRLVTPYILVHFDMSTKIWQCSLGTTFHFKRKKRR